MNKSLPIIGIVAIVTVAVVLVYSLLSGIAHTRKLGMDYCLTQYTQEQCYLYAE